VAAHLAIPPTDATIKPSASAPPTAAGKGEELHSSSLTSGQVRIDYQRAFAVIKPAFAEGAYTFEIPWDEAEANKQHIDDVIARYW
jgi:hypothetical protein